jgi:hypothetical protein
MVYSTWRGIAYGRQLVIPSNPRTDDQIATRAALGAVGKVTKASDKAGTEILFIKSNTPSGLAWNSFYGREFIGAGLVNFDEAKALYVNVANATVAGYFDAAALAAGIENVVIPGETPVTVPAGLSLWAGFAASYRLKSPNAEITGQLPTEAQVETYTTALCGTVFA